MWKSWLPGHAESRRSRRSVGREAIRPPTCQEPRGGGRHFFFRPPRRVCRAALPPFRRPCRPGPGAPRVVPSRRLSAFPAPQGLLGAVPVHQECLGATRLALPLRRNFCLYRERHLESMSVLACVLHRLARGQIDAAVRLVAGNHKSRAAESSLTHESCLPGLSPTGQMSLSSSSGQRPVGGKDSRCRSCVARRAAALSGLSTRPCPVCHLSWMLSLKVEPLPLAVTVLRAGQRRTLPAFEFNV